MSEITIGEHTFVLGRMPVRKQFHVARRLAPLFSAFIGQAGVDGLKNGLADLQIQPIMDALATMKDDDCDYVLDACLSVVKIMQAGRATPIMASNGRLMFDDITMPQMLQIAAEVVMQDLAGFMAGVRSPSDAPAAA